jgi:hypothetical protein
MSSAKEFKQRIRIAAFVDIVYKKGDSTDGTGDVECMGFQAEVTVEVQFGKQRKIIDHYGGKLYLTYARAARKIRRRTGVRLTRIQHDRPTEIKGGKWIELCVGYFVSEFQPSNKRPEEVLAECLLEDRDASMMPFRVPFSPVSSNRWKN